MEYTINKLAQIAGVSTRTLRYYDQIGLLQPRRVSSNGYRIYGAPEVDRLQQIMFYRELGVPLEEIGKILSADDFDNERALEAHRTALNERREQLDKLIATVELTIEAKKGRVAMSDAAKFEGFKRQLVEENERTFGAEVRERYGEESVETSNASLMGLSAERYAELTALEARVKETLAAAVATGDAASAQAQEAAALHGQWLGFMWGNYSAEAHVGVTQLYLEDERFAAYYDAVAPGATQFLHDAVAIHAADR